MKYQVILLLIIVLLFLFNIKEKFSDKQNITKGTMTKTNPQETDDIIETIFNDKDYVEDIKNKVISEYKNKFTNLSDLSNHIKKENIKNHMKKENIKENIINDINKQLKLIFLKDNKENLVKSLTNTIKNDESLIKGEKGDKGDRGVLTSNPTGDILAKSVSIYDDKNNKKDINNDTLRKIQDTNEGKYQIFSKETVNLGNLDSKKVTENALNAENVFLGNKPLRGSTMDNAIDFGNQLNLNELKIGNQKMTHLNNKIKFDNLQSSNLNVDNLTVKNSTYSEMQAKGDQGDKGIRGMYPSESELIQKGNSSKINFFFNDGEKETIDVTGELDFTNVKRQKGVKGIRGNMGDTGDRGNDLTSFSFDKKTGKMKFNGKVFDKKLNLTKGYTGDSGYTGDTGPRGYSINKGSIDNNSTLVLLNDNNEKKTIDLPRIEGSKGFKGEKGNKGVDLNSPGLFDSINYYNNSIIVNDPITLKKNACFNIKKEDGAVSKFCLNKTNFEDNVFSKQIIYVLNLLGVTIDYKKHDLNHLKKIITVNADKLGYQTSNYNRHSKNEEHNFNNVLAFLRTNKILNGILKKFEISLHNKSLKEALERVEYFKDILDIKEDIFHYRLIVNDNFIRIIDSVLADRKKILEKILFVDNLFEINLTKNEINQKINNYFCKTRFMGYHGSNSNVCNPNLTLNNFNELKNRLNSVNNKMSQIR